MQYIGGTINMKKVAILTINDYNNYGNRLQNYATQEVLRGMGLHVKTIVNNTKYENKNNKNSRIKYKIRKVKHMSVNEIYEKTNSRLWNYVHRREISECKAKRIRVFKQFTDNYIDETNYCISNNNVPNDLADKFDYFITGSDQVWNPTFKRFSQVDFLTFAPKHKRISYAPSFGISEIPFEHIENYKVWLSQMDKLSVREEAGAKIIKDLTDRDAIVLVDPTMMLTKEKWLSISRAADNKPKNKYLLTYFLGKVSKKTKETIKIISNKNRLEVVNLADIRDGETYIAGPSEFIDYINSASVFLTDSFHGAVFSILLEKPFIVFDRKGNYLSMNSRIETLLNMFKLSSRKSNNIFSNNQVFEVDYSHVPPILEKERKKAIGYLKDALNVMDGVKYEN